MNIQISIIIPHYNTPHLLQVLLGSIPKRDDFQVIVVDDNSSKNRDVLEKVVQEDNRCEFYVNNHDVKGAGTCRNIGLKYAKGKWLLFADSDDYFVCGFDTIIEKYFNNTKDIIFFEPISIYIDTREPASRHIFFQNLIRQYVAKNDSKNELKLRYCFVTPCSKLIRKSIVDKNSIKFDEIIVANDVMFSVRIGKFARRIAVCRETIYVITRSEGSLTMQMEEKLFDIRLSLAIKSYNYIRKNVSKKDLSSLGIGLSGYVVLAWNLFGFRKALKVYLQLKKYKICILRLKYLNPIILMKKIIERNQFLLEIYKYGVK